MQSGPTPERPLTLGATYLGEGRCRFRVWAPSASKVGVHFLTPEDRTEPLESRRRGYHQAVVDGVELGSQYMLVLDGKTQLPDPASRYQPHSLGKPSRVVDSALTWNDDRWFGLAMQNLILYEIHVGAFTPEGTFGAILPHISYLSDLGVTAIQLMPVTQFPGKFSWGYDSVFPFAVQNSYGGPTGLKRLVDACHVQGIAVVLDVNYSFVGFEGGFLSAFGPYFNTERQSPYGLTINYDGAYSDEVRHYFIENALYWFTEFHIDALKLTGLHNLIDNSAKPFLKELVGVVGNLSERINRRIYLFCDSDLNDSQLILPQELGGYGLDSCWNADFHHSLHALLTGDQTGFFKDFGKLQQLARCYQDGFFYTGQRSNFRKRRHGASSAGIPARKLTVSSQFHAEIGNRLEAERLDKIVSFDSLKLAAGATLFAPYVPMLFMGEEYMEAAPFHYFTDTTDKDQIQRIKSERQAHFDAIGARGKGADPFDEDTYLASHLNHDLRREGQHQVLLSFYKEALRLRKEILALNLLSNENLEVNGWERDKVLFLRRWCAGSEVVVALNFSDEEISLVLPVPVGTWHKRLDSAAEIWGGEGSKAPEVLHSVGEAAVAMARRSVTLYEMEARD